MKYLVISKTNLKTKNVFVTICGTIENARENAKTDMEQDYITEATIYKAEDANFCFNGKEIETYKK